MSTNDDETRYTDIGEKRVEILESATDHSAPLVREVAEAVLQSIREESR